MSRKVMWSLASADEDAPTIVPHTDQSLLVSVLRDMAAQGSIVLTELQGRWSPVTSLGGLSSMVLVNELVTRPRYVPIITCGSELGHAVPENH